MIDVFVKDRLPSLLLEKEGALFLTEFTRQTIFSHLEAVQKKQKCLDGFEVEVLKIYSVFKQILNIEDFLNRDIKVLDGKNHSVRYFKGITFYQLKCQLFVKTGILPGNQQLICGSEQYDDMRIVDENLLLGLNFFVMLPRHLVQ